MGDHTTLIRLSNITKRYGLTEVLSEVSFDLREGEVHAIVGENGAGKTTLLKILYGLVDRDGGEIWIKGNKLENPTTVAVKRLGVALVPQKLQTLESLSVAENFFIDDWPRNKRTGLIDWKEMEEQARKLLAKVNSSIDPTRKMGSLSYVDQQMVVITRMLFAENADIILLDEPTAPLVDKEIRLLFDFIESLKEEGYSFVYISHYLDEVFQICDRATVLRDGEAVFTRDVDSLSMSELVTGMVGEDVELFPGREHHLGDPIFEVRHLEIAPLVKDLNLRLREGEILGLAGLKGSGRTETARALCGLDAVDGGEVYLRGEPAAIRDVGDALDLGIGYLTEDRIKWGLIGCRPLYENATLTFLKRLTSRLGLIRHDDERFIVKKFIKDFDIRTSGLEQRASYLSGGNQQKVILAKLLGADLDILFLDDPTFGIDVKAKTHVYRIMNDFVESGNSIVLISSVALELVELCDRILILKDGRTDRAYERGELTERQLQEVLER